MCLCRLMEQGDIERRLSHKKASTSGSSGRSSSSHSSSSSSQVWDLPGLNTSSLMPGQSHTPARIGRDLHELMAEGSPEDRPPGLHSGLCASSCTKDVCNYAMYTTNSIVCIVGIAGMCLMHCQSHTLGRICRDVHNSMGDKPPGKHWHLYMR